MMLVLILLVQVIGGFAQKEITVGEESWFGILTQTRLTDHWGIWLDAHYRVKDHFMENASLFIVRPGITYYLNNDVRLTTGYACLDLYPGEGHENVTQPEHRIWQQLQWYTKYNEIRLMQCIRLEERFKHKLLNDDELANGYNFNYRTRYNLQLTVPLTKKGFAPGGWQAAVGDEILINFGKKVVYNYFDQNRLFMGMVYPFTNHNQISAGYVNLFQQLSGGNKYKQLHMIRILYFHNFDWRK